MKYSAAHERKYLKAWRTEKNMKKKKLIKQFVIFSANAS